MSSEQGRTVVAIYKPEFKPEAMHTLNKVRGARRLISLVEGVVDFVGLDESNIGEILEGMRSSRINEPLCDNYSEDRNETEYKLDVNAQEVLRKGQDYLSRWVVYNSLWGKD